MPNFKLGKMTIRSLFKKPETIMYPLESPEPYAAMRGHVDVEPQKCVLCSICQRVCPTNSIVVDKKGASWTINWFSCVICGECVRACPHDALDMHTARLE
ncbi:MAG: 4Fe-4S dicluster domain-containing protein, partial [Slackia sp.]|nr:4Fe-4S dicluster domain-containing protein [Slackia sp.]